MGVAVGVEGCLIVVIENRGEKRISESNLTRILIVDDHPMVRAGLRAMLYSEETLQVVGEAGTVAEAIEQARDLQPKVVLLDLQLPDQDGFKALARIKAEVPHAQVLIVTMHENTAHAHQAKQAGAAGYLVKGVRRRDLIHAIHTVATDRSPLVPFLINPCAGLVRAATEATPMPQLKPVEHQILRLIADGFSNREISAHMKWSLGTVKKYVQELFQALDVSDRTQAVAVAMRIGLIQ